MEERQCEWVCYYTHGSRDRQRGEILVPNPYRTATKIEDWYMSNTHAELTPDPSDSCWLVPKLTFEDEND